MRARWFIFEFSLAVNCTSSLHYVCLRCVFLSYSCLSLCSICRCRLSALLAKSSLKRLVPSSAEVRCLSASCNLHHYNQGQTQDHGERERKLGEQGEGMRGEKNRAWWEGGEETGKGLRSHGGWGDGWCNTREWTNRGKPRVGDGQRNTKRCRVHRDKTMRWQWAAQRQRLAEIRHIITQITPNSFKTSNFICHGGKRQ